MTESLVEMSQRVGAFQRGSVPDEDVFEIAPAVTAKVAAVTGELLPFYGSTVVHYLNAGTCDLLTAVADDLYAACGDGLAAPLPPDSLHVTLHDLRASPHLEDIADAVFLDDPRTGALVAEARALGPVDMRFTTVFNMVNTSVVVGLLPASEADCARLLAARALLDEIVPSGPFTPHVTLAYYRPAAAAPVDPRHLAETLDRLTERVAERPVTLAPERLRSTHFSTMATFWDAGPA
ncbi:MULTISPECIES: hypothetical protein [unclassified Actinotalea]|uniref:hypothetical protein n=1 Tax=unclassified Actinotalea TaxID=2638618 RepID=UPI0015F60B3A|nr:MULTISPECIES: hypothetical protein [unclassified Actinotalea]